MVLTLPFLCCLAAVAVAFAAGILIGARRGVPFTTREKCFSIAIYAGESLQTLKPAPGAACPVLTAQAVTDVPALFIADPFLVKSRGREPTNAGWHMFFEIQPRRKKPGVIGHATSPDGLRWTYDRVVLREPFHLSYPQVIEDGGAFYMLPECGRSKSVRLYRAASFPDRWEFVKELLTGDAFSDSTVFRHDGRWYMFTCTGLHENLRLFEAPTLEGAWQEHPRSPILRGTPHHARPAGSVVQREGQLIRFAQDDYPSYGRQVWGFVITRLTPEEYSEEPLGTEPLLAPGQAKWNQYGMHHIDAHEVVPGKWLACVDGLGKYRLFGLDC